MTDPVEELAALHAQRAELNQRIAALRGDRIPALYAEAIECGQRLSQLSEETKRASSRRAEALRALNDYGESFRTIGERIGLSAPRIGQILNAPIPAAPEESTDD